MGKENASLCGITAKTLSDCRSVKQQEEAIGKALWRQVTTVVILRKNMRQTSQTDQDARLRTALENMRYKSCTPNDILFLKSLVTGPGPRKPKKTDPRFGDVSIITAWNSQKNRINDLGSQRYALETNQTLSTFDSIDTLKSCEDTKRKHRRKGEATSKDIRDLSMQTKMELWSLPCSASKQHIAGSLSLCLGLQVIIKENIATELCITNGQEGTVAGWQSEPGPDGQPVLDVLFVKLTSPPEEVQIPGLPPNVVPIPRARATTVVTLKNDKTISISREQVKVLPCFSMTDYASQGKTRLNNVVDLQNCSTHQSYYVCLSRRASAAGTAILGGFHAKKITGGASGRL